MYKTSKTVIRSGLLTIWTWYVATSPFHALHSDQHRRSVFSIPPVPLLESAYEISEEYVALEEYYQHHTPFHLTI